MLLVGFTIRTGSLEEALDFASGARLERPVTKYGLNTNVAAGSTVDIWANGGLWVPPTDARIHNIASNDPQDNPGGTGAGQVVVFGFDADYLPISEVVTLNGTTNVPTVKAYRRVHRLRCLSAGSTGTNVGTITATAQVDGTVSANAPAEQGSSLKAIDTVPAGCKGYLLQFAAGLSRAGGNLAAAARARLQVREAIDQPRPCWQTRFTLNLTAGGSSDVVHHFPLPLEIIGPADIRLQVSDVTDSGSRCEGSFTMLLRKNAS